MINALEPLALTLGWGLLLFLALIAAAGSGFGVILLVAWLRVDRSPAGRAREAHYARCDAFVWAPDSAVPLAKRTTPAPLARRSPEPGGELLHFPADWERRG